MQFGKLLTMALLGVTAAAAQNQAQGVFNNSIYEILTSRSPTLAISKFAGLLQSDSGYQPVIDLLSQPGNVTAFIPNDYVLTKYLIWLKTYNKYHGINMTGDYPPANMSSGNTTVLDVVTYHIATPAFALSNLTGYKNVVNSVLNKTDVSPLGIGLPILINTNASYQEFNNATWLTTNSRYLKYEVGNSERDTDVRQKDIIASNGYLNTISSVMIPPLNFSNVLALEGKVSIFSRLLKQYPGIENKFGLANNCTIFAPSNRALQHTNFENITQEALEKFLLDYAVEGVYYSTNLTELATQNNGNITLNTCGNTSLPLFFNSTSGRTTIKDITEVDDTDIFYNSGVIHIIDSLYTQPLNSNSVM